MVACGAAIYLSPRDSRPHLRGRTSIAPGVGLDRKSSFTVPSRLQHSLRPVSARLLRAFAIDRGASPRDLGQSSASGSAFSWHEPALTISLGIRESRKARALFVMHSIEACLINPWCLNNLVNVSGFSRERVDAQR